MKLTKQRLLSDRDSYDVEVYCQEPIAIIGMGCRFPGDIKTPKQFWELLRDSVDAISVFPKNRCDLRTYNIHADYEKFLACGGFLTDVASFDAAFFGISPREAMTLDPQQRLVLEVSWEALESAAIAPDTLSNSATGVFLGICSNDYRQLIQKQGFAEEKHPLHKITGNSGSIAAGRLSYSLGLKGPSIAVDTACSSSLVAVHLACQSLRSQECSLAIVGGANLILDPDTTIAFSQAGMLSPMGRCKTFDAAADGYVRGEGIGIVVLKRLADAEEDGDNILAVIRGTTINQCGRSGGLTVPHGPSQQAVIRDALQKGNVLAAQVGYIEAHGTGTSLGDPIELQALHAVFGNRNYPLWIGSVKTNIGHLEAVAGIAGLIKVVLSLKYGEIPAHLHCHNPTQLFNWEQSPLRVPSTRIPWSEGQRIAGVSSFGFGGTNAHAVLESAPTLAYASSNANRQDNILTLSAKSQSALRDIAQQYHDRFGDNNWAAEANWGDICFTANTGRTHFQYRLSLLASTLAQARKQLLSYMDGSVEFGVWQGNSPEGGEPKIAFFFSGQYSQALKFGDDRPATPTVFRQTLEQCDRLLRPHLQQPLTELAYGMTALFVLEYALAEQWKSWGIWPELVMGSGVGEYVAACVAGIFSLEDGLKLVLSHDGVKEGLPTDSFTTVARAITYAPAEVPMISSVTGNLVSDEVSTPEYWVQFVRGRDHLGDGVAMLHQEAVEILLEIGPKSALLKDLLQDSEVSATLVKHFCCDGEWQQVLECVAQLYVLGAKVDWKAFYAGELQFLGDRTLDCQYRKVLLPTYPFQRQRYWLNEETAPVSDTVPVGESWKDWLYTLTWHPRPVFGLASNYFCSVQQVSQKLSAEVEALLAEFDLQRHTTIQGQLAGICTSYAIAAFAKGGWELREGSHRSLQQVAQQMGIASQHYRLLKRLLNMLAEDGILASVGGEKWEVLKTPEILDPEQQVAKLVKQYGTIVESESSLLRGCASHLLEMLRGEQDPLELLFPAGDTSMATKLYRDSPIAQMMNHLVQKAVLSAIDQLPSEQGLRILELGAGTGGTTSWLLPHLPVSRTEYTFTDISPTFVNKAQEKFSAFDFLRFQPLNIEQSPAQQGFALHQYDIVIAANVLHATRDLRQTLDCVQQLLAPGGLLVLWEATAHHRWIDLTFGLTDGWWRFADLRQEYPLISATDWQELLHDCGFCDTVCLPGTATTDELGQVAIIAKIGEIPSPPAREWLLFADRFGVAEELAAQLLSRGDKTTLVYSDTSYQKIDDRTFQIRSMVVDDYHQLLASLPDLYGIVHLWSLDAAKGQELTEAKLRLALELGCGSVLFLVQQLQERRFQVPSALLLVTQNAQVVVSQEGAEGYSQSALWGMAKTIRQEHPELNCRTIDIDSIWNNTAAKLLTDAVLGAEELEAEIAFRDRTQYVPRLTRLQLDSRVDRESVIQAEATYLITGGIGGIGLVVAEWLISQGATSIALLARKQVSQEVQSKLNEFEDRGATVTVFQADVSNRQQLEDVLGQIQATMFPLRGIVHTAGILDERLLKNHDWAAYERVFAPKVLGAWNLHLLTQSISLDFFVLCSSGSALMGGIGSSNYAAANRFMSMLAHHRKHQGLSAVCLDWGVWDNVGMARELGLKRDEHWQATGIEKMQSAVALSAFSAFLTQSVPQAAVMRMDWSKVSPDAFLQNLLSEGRETPLVEHQQSQKQSASSKITRELLIENLRSIAATILELPVIDEVNPSLSLIDAGMDSLMELDLRNEIRKEYGIGTELKQFLIGMSIAQIAEDIFCKLAESDLGNDTRIPEEDKQKNQGNQWIKGTL